MRRLRALLALALAAWLQSASAADPAAEQDAARLVAMLSSRFADGERLGAGIIVGLRGDSLIIATANHNVRWGGAEATGIEVRIKGVDRPLPATLSAHFDPQLDLAVLRVDGAIKAGLDPASIPFERLGNPQAVKRGDQVFPMGNPGRPWAISFTPDRLADVQNEQLYFESNFIAVGHSGGALWDVSLDLIGMVRADQPPHGAALSITAVLERVQRWGYPVQLGAPLQEQRFEQVATGSDHACALTSRGDAWCFGAAGGKLGSGTDVASDRLRRVLGGHRFRAIGVGRDFSCALDADGRARCWGSNVFGELGDGSPATLDPQTTYRTVPVAVAGAQRFRSLSVGRLPASCALTADGAAWCWGDMSRRQRAPKRIDGLEPLVSVYAGEQSACGMTAQGQVICWSLNPFDTGSQRGPTPLANAPRFKSIAIGGDSRQTGCGIDAGDKAHCWGSNVRGQLGNGRGGAPTLANDSDAPVPVGSQQSFAKISVGENHACAIARDGTAWCWGANDAGQLGDGSRTDRNAPVRVQGATKFAQVSAGGSMTCAVTTAGALVCWGQLRGRPVTEPMPIGGSGR